MYTTFILDKHSQLTYFMITFFTLFLFFDLCFDFLTFVKNSRPLWKHVFTQQNVYKQYGIYKMSVRSSHSQMFFKISVLKSFAIFTKKTPVLESLFNDVAVLDVCNFTKKKLQHSCFPVSIAKFLIIAFLQNTSWFKTFYSKQKTQKAQKEEKVVFEKKLQKMQKY